jgi:hypothetical protein
MARVSVKSPGDPGCNRYRSSHAPSARTVVGCTRLGIRSGWRMRRPWRRVAAISTRRAFNESYFCLVQAQSLAQLQTPLLSHSQLFLPHALQLMVSSSFSLIACFGVSKAMSGRRVRGSAPNLHRGISARCSDRIPNTRGRHGFLRSRRDLFHHRNQRAATFSCVVEIRVEPRGDGRAAAAPRGGRQGLYSCERGYVIRQGSCIAFENLPNRSCGADVIPPRHLGGPPMTFLWLPSLLR